MVRKLNINNLLLIYAKGANLDFFFRWVDGWWVEPYHKIDNNSQIIFLINRYIVFFFYQIPEGGGGPTPPPTTPQIRERCYRFLSVQYAILVSFTKKNPFILH